MNKIWPLHSPCGRIINSGEECAGAIKESCTRGRMDTRFFYSKGSKCGFPALYSQFTNYIFCCGWLVVTKEFQSDSLWLETSLEQI